MSLESSTYKDRLRLMTDSLSEKAVGTQNNELANRTLATEPCRGTLRGMEPVLPETLAERLFSGDSFAFGFGMQRPRQEWFGWDDPRQETLRDRHHWLSQEPQRHLAWTDEASPVLLEALALFPNPPFPKESSHQPDPRPDGLLKSLSLNWEPDLLLLRRDASGQFRLVAGAVCFPSAWDLREKLGKTVDAIHADVPTLNATLGARIRTFLDRLQPGQTFERDNWGLAAHGERNAHPDRNLPRLTDDATLDTTWLRLEHQAFRALPNSGGLLFAIHLTVHPLERVLQAPAARDQLAAQLRSMPEAIAAYKGILPARETLVRQLESR